MRGQRAIRHLDREEFQLFGPGRARDRISAEDRLAFDHQADHREFARTETEAIWPGHRETEEPVSVMRHAQHRLGINAGGNGGGEFFGLCRSVHFDIGLVVRRMIIGMRGRYYKTSLN